MNGPLIRESVREEAQQEGIENPTVFVFLPRLAADELKQAIAQLEAAKETLSTKPTPATGGGIEARAAMNSRSQVEERRLNDLVNDIVKQATVYQGGGSEAGSESFSHVYQASRGNKLRLGCFPDFSVADQQWLGHSNQKGIRGRTRPPGCTRVHRRSGPDIQVCQEVRNFVGNNGNKGQRSTSTFSRSHRTVGLKTRWMAHS